MRKRLEKYLPVTEGLVVRVAIAIAALFCADAHADDRPIKPVQYVKICSDYGAGFYYVPGTETCLRFGGYYREEVNINATGSLQPAWTNSLGAQDRNSQRFLLSFTRGV